jgi:hypothetical protein
MTAAMAPAAAAAVPGPDMDLNSTDLLAAMEAVASMSNTWFSATTSAAPEGPPACSMQQLSLSGKSVGNSSVHGSGGSGSGSGTGNDSSKEIITLFPTQPQPQQQQQLPLPQRLPQQVQQALAGQFASQPLLLQQQPLQPASAAVGSAGMPQQLPLGCLNGGAVNASMSQQQQVPMSLQPPQRQQQQPMFNVDAELGEALGIDQQTLQLLLKGDFAGQAAAGAGSTPQVAAAVAAADAQVPISAPFLAPKLPQKSAAAAAGSACDMTVQRAAFSAAMPQPAASTAGAGSSAAAWPADTTAAPAAAVPVANLFSTDAEAILDHTLDLLLAAYPGWQVVETPATSAAVSPAGSGLTQAASPPPSSLTAAAGLATSLSGEGMYAAVASQALQQGVVNSGVNPGMNSGGMMLPGQNFGVSSAMLQHQAGGMQSSGSSSMSMQLQQHQTLQQQQQQQMSMPMMQAAGMVSSMGMAVSAAAAGMGTAPQMIQQQSQPLLQQSWQQGQQYSPPYQGQQLSPEHVQMQQQQLMAPSMQSQYMPPQLPQLSASMHVQQQQHGQLLGYHQQQQPMLMAGVQGANHVAALQPPPVSVPYMQQQQQLAPQQQPYLAPQQQQQPYLQQQQQQHYMAQQQATGTCYNYQLVRISLKLHGVTPDQLPVPTVAALNKLLSTSAAELETLLLGPAIRPGCVQLELDVLVKCPEVSREQQQLMAAGDILEGASTATTAGSAAAAAAADGQEADSAAAAAAAGIGGDEVPELLHCAALTRAEQQLRQLLPFATLVAALLDVPADEAVTDAGSSSSSGGLRLGLQLTAVFAQIGGELGAWRHGQLLHDWSDSASYLEDAHPAAAAASRAAQAAAAAASRVAQAAAPASSSSSSSIMPKVLSVKPWSTFASAATGKQVQVQVCIAAAASGSSGGSETAAPLKLWAVMRSAFCALDSRLIQQQQQQQGLGLGLVHQLTVQLADDAAGLLLIQAERQLPLSQQLVQQQQQQSAAADPAAAAAVDEEQPGQLDHDSWSCMSVLLPVVICSSAEMAAEVEHKLHAQPPASAYQMRVHLGLLLDFAAMLKQQQQQQGKALVGLTEQQLQHRQHLLTSRQYISALR